MSGLDKIKDRILQEAQEQADEKIREAEKEAGEIKSEAVREADDIAKEVLAKAESDVLTYKERVDSAIDLEDRTRILEAKQEIIGDVLEEAKRRILSLDTNDYFALLLKLIEKNIMTGEGTVYLTESDLERMPSGFTGEVRKIAEKHGADLSVSMKGHKIGQGIVLSYGGIEENCTFDALFEEKKDDLTDIVQTILFS